MSTLIFLGIVFLAGVLGLGAYEVIVRITGVKAYEEKSEISNLRLGSTQAINSKTAKSKKSSMLLKAGQVLNLLLPMSRISTKKLAEKLNQAGLSIQPETWHSFQVFCIGFGCVAAFFTVNILSQNLFASVFAAVFGGFLAWCLQQAYLNLKVKTRMAQIDAALPDAMELLGVALAAGSPVEQSFKEVSKSLTGPIAQELSVIDREVNLAGKTREAALEAFSVRVPTQEVGAFVAQITQALNQGSSIAAGLVNQAALMRERTQAEMLQEIRKMPTKLDVVLSLCFVPPTTILVLVPTVIRLLSFLRGGMT